MRYTGFESLSGTSGLQFISLYRVFLRLSAFMIGLLAWLAASSAATSGEDPAPTLIDQNLLPIMERNIDVSRVRSTKRPRGVGDQAIVNGWPLYRTNRGQQAFNHAMATLQATDSPAPGIAAFKGCDNLNCNIILPKIDRDGWLPAGRLWISPDQYVLITHSPRRSRKKKTRRNSLRRMKYFVFHEFQNSTHNTDPYDTISAHKFSVYVSFYMGKRRVDARGNEFVVVVQVAPYDARSIHASNKGSAGPGIEVAKNTAGALEPLQGAAGILIATMVKTRLPKLRVVNHRGNEGRPMLRAYRKRLALLKVRVGAPRVKLPFVPAKRMHLARVSGVLGDLIARPGSSPKSSTRLAYYKPGNTNTAVPRVASVMKEAFVRKALPRVKSPPVGKNAPVANGDPIARHLARLAKTEMPALSELRVPVVQFRSGMSPLATYLKENLLLMKQEPHFARFIHSDVTAVLEDWHEPGIVYLLDGRHNVVGKIHAHSELGSLIKDSYVYAPIGQASAQETIFRLKIRKPVPDQIASLAQSSGASGMPTLIGKPRLVSRPISPPEPVLIGPPIRANGSNRAG